MTEDTDTVTTAADAKGMKVIIAGSRDISDYELVCRAVKESGFTPAAIVSGLSRGVDRLGMEYARRHGIPCHGYPAEWDKHGRQAGYIRNHDMARNADAVIAVWDGRSPGTKHMIDIATRRALRVYVYRVGYRPPG
jgi:hypothetical protein